MDPYPTPVPYCPVGGYVPALGPEGPTGSLCPQTERVAGRAWQGHPPLGKFLSWVIILILVPRKHILTKEIHRRNREDREGKAAQMV